MNCCTKCCSYSILIINFIFDYIVLFFACLCTRNTKTLNGGHKFFIALWIIIFLCNTLWNLVKFILIIKKKLNYYTTYNIDLIMNFSGMGIFTIAIIYDLVLICKKEIKFVAYELFLWLGIMIYVLLSFISHFKLDDFCILSMDNTKDRQMKGNELELKSEIEE